MKSVSGKVLSTKPVSLSKAAKVLSNFVSVYDGSSQAVSVYLRRASASFNELVQFHKELNASSHSHRKLKKHRLKSVNDENPIKAEENHEEAEAEAEAEADRVENSGKHRKHRHKNINNEDTVKTKKNPSEVEEDRRKSAEDSVRKRDKMKKKSGGEDREGGGGLEIEERLTTEEGQRRKRKKRKSGEVDDGEVAKLAEQIGAKKKKKRKIEGNG